MRHVFYPLLACLLLLLAPVAVAQDTPPQTTTANHPLLETLALLPDVPSVTETFISYVDYAAMMTAIGDVRPADYAAWAAFSSFEEGLWGMSMSRLFSPPNVFQLLPELEDAAVFNGFDVFDIDRAVTFGVPPLNGLLYGLDYDRDAVIAAFTARDYALVEVGGLPALCTTPACDQGNALDDDNRDTRNLFDTAIFRRRPPVLLLDAVLASAYLPEVLETLASTAAGDAPSLLQDPTYRALADATIAEAAGGSIIQVQIWSPLQIDVGAVLVTPEQREVVVAYLGEDDLPAYRAAAFMDLQLDGGTQAAVIALALDTDADSEAVADLLERRLVAYAPVFYGETTPFLEELEGDYEVVSTVYPPVDPPDDEEASVTIVSVSVRYPSPEIGRGTGEVFRWWVIGLNGAEFYPLWADIMG